jgi:hypothetical protein
MVGARTVQWWSDRSDQAVALRNKSTASAASPSSHFFPLSRTRYLDAAVAADDDPDLATT